MKKNDLIPILEVFESKKGSEKEYFINFFEKCNLRCSFCWQDHGSEEGIEDVVSKAKLIIDRSVNDEFSVINVMGGELFMDSLPDTILEDYLDFASKIDEVKDNYVINFVTNLVFLKTDRVLNFLERLSAADINYRLVTSYDPAGRFNKRTLEIFKNNVELFKDVISNISMVLTKPNIRRAKEDLYLHDLIKRFEFYMDYYSPETRTKEHQPADHELVDFFLWVSERFKSVEPIRSMREDFSSKTSCRSSLIVLPSGETGSCRILANTADFVVDMKDQDLDSSIVDFLNGRKCLECEHYSYCTLGCFLRSSHIDITNKECEFKRFYSHARNVRNDE